METSTLVEHKTETLPAPTRQPKNGVMMLLEKYKGRIEKSIPARYLSPERALNLAVNAFNKTPELLRCTPISVINSIVHISQLGLEIRPSEAYLVPYGKECVPIIDYRGKIKIARRGGEVRDIIADIVYANDEFEYKTDQAGRNIRHVPKPADPKVKNSRGELIGAFCIVWMKGDPQPHIDFMWRYQIEEVRAMSKQANGQMWTRSYEEACKKTVVHRTMKLLPQDDDMQRAQDLDDKVDAGLEIENLVDVAPEDEKAAEDLNRQALPPEPLADTRTLKEKLQDRHRDTTPTPRSGDTPPAEAAHATSGATAPTNVQDSKGGASDGGVSLNTPAAQAGEQPAQPKSSVMFFEGDEWPSNAPADGQPFFYNNVKYAFDENAGNFRKIDVPPAEKEKGKRK